MVIKITLTFNTNDRTHNSLLFLSLFPQLLYENGVNGILGDEMGLGKTIQCISVIAYMLEQGVTGPFLVAAPLSTVPNWVAEFKRFAPKVSGGGGLCNIIIFVLRPIFSEDTAYLGYTCRLYTCNYRLYM